MNLERGFHRVTLSISLAAVIVGVTITVYAIRLTVISVSGMKSFLVCSQDTGPLSKLSNNAELCLSILANSAIPEPFHKYITPYFGEGFLWWDWLDSLLSLFFSMTTKLYTLVLIPFIEGIIVTTFLGAILGACFTCFVGLRLALRKNSRPDRAA